MAAIDNPKPVEKTEEVEEINREDVEAAAEKLDEIKESNNHKDMWDFGD